MTLEEAIEHCRNVANITCGGCSDEHKQLSEWLEELQRRRTGDGEKKERITRCRNCEKLDTLRMPDMSVRYTCLRARMPTSLKGFCAWGKPKEKHHE